jgi:hypothetical protein
LTIAPQLIDIPADKSELVVEKVAITRPEWRGKGGELADTVAKAHKHLSIKYGLAYDSSVADFQIARSLIEQGWSSSSVRSGLLNGSPDLLTRKTGHVDDYLDRTLSKVTGRPVAKADADVDRPSPRKQSHHHPRPR